MKNNTPIVFIKIKGLFILSFLALAFVTNSTKAQIIYTIAGNGTAFESGNGGQASACELNSPAGIARDDSGNIYISDDEGEVVRKLTIKTGIITLYAGNGKGGFSGDGGPATAAQLLKPGNICFDKQGNLYIADVFNQRIRKVDKTTGFISTFAGNGSAGYGGDGGPATAASFFYPGSVSIDSAGNIFIPDELNNVIREIKKNDTIYTAVGLTVGGYAGDGGPASSAKLTTPVDVAFDSSWNMYIADGNNVIRKVSVTTGIITSIAGNGVEGFGGDGGPATASEIDGIVGLAIDAMGNIYLSDLDDERIREVYASTGMINTIIGTGNGAFSGDNGLATAAEIHWPYYLVLDQSGNLIFDDNQNDRVREVTNVVGIAPLPTANNNLIVYPSPASDHFYVTTQNNLEEGTTLNLYNMLGQSVWRSYLNKTTQTVTVPVGYLSDGIYILSLQNKDGYTITKKIKIANRK